MHALKWPINSARIVLLGWGQYAGQMKVFLLTKLVLVVVAA